MSKSLDIAGVYKIDFGGSQVYIGSAVSINGRCNQHLSHLRRNVSSCRKLQRAFNKYGENRFYISIIVVCSIDRLRDIEQQAIKVYNSVDNGYNLSYDTSIPMLGKTHSATTKKLMSLKATGNTSNTGRKFSVEHKSKLGKNPRRGEQSGTSKLTEADVRLIRRLLSVYKQKEIALLFGVRDTAISKIKTKVRWQHLK